MKRFRHPIRAIREPFGTAGLIVAMIALVAALGGSALAANGALSAKQRKEVEKIAKKYAGKPGAAGAIGPAGPGGKEGAPGKEGGAGKEGAAGRAGTDGTNGTTGFTKTLPGGQTETGAWAAHNEGEEDLVLAPISFSIPLPAEIEPAQVFWDRISAEGGTAGEAEFEAQCPGSVEVPLAEPGNLCVYTGRASGIEPTQIIKPSGVFVPGAGTNGAVLELTQAEGTGYGSWAVTAP